VIVDSDYLFNLIRSETQSGTLSINLLYKGVVKFTKSLLKTRPNLENLFFCCHLLSEDSPPFQQCYKPSFSPNCISPIFLNGDDVSPLAVNLHDGFALEDHSFTILNDPNYKPFIYSRVFQKFFDWLEDEEEKRKIEMVTNSSHKIEEDGYYNSFTVHVCFPLSDVFVSGNMKGAQLSVNTMVVRREKKVAEVEEITIIKTTCVDSFMNNKSRPFMQAKFLIEMLTTLKHRIEWHCDWKHDVDCWGSALLLFSDELDVMLSYFGYRFFNLDRTTLKRHNAQKKLILWMAKAIAFRSLDSSGTEQYDEIISYMFGDEREEPHDVVEEKKNNTYVIDREVILNEILKAGIAFLNVKYGEVDQLISFVDKITYPHKIYFHMLPEMAFNDFNSDVIDMSTCNFIQSPFLVKEGFKIVSKDDKIDWNENRTAVKENLMKVKQFVNEKGKDSFSVFTVKLIRCLFHPITTSNINLIVWIILQ
jgi:hypothetical protein